MNEKEEQEEEDEEEREKEGRASLINQGAGSSNAC